MADFVPAAAAPLRVRLREDDVGGEFDQTWAARDTVYSAADAGEDWLLSRHVNKVTELQTPETTLDDFTRANEATLAAPWGAFTNPGGHVSTLCALTNNRVTASAAGDSWHAAVHGTALEWQEFVGFGMLVSAVPANSSVYCAMSAGPDDNAAEAGFTFDGSTVTSYAYSYADFAAAETFNISESGTIAAGTRIAVTLDRHGRIQSWFRPSGDDWRAGGYAWDPSLVGRPLYPLIWASRLDAHELDNARTLVV